MVDAIRTTKSTCSYVALQNKLFVSLLAIGHLWIFYDSDSKILKMFQVVFLVAVYLIHQQSTATGNRKLVSCKQLLSVIKPIRIFTIFLEYLEFGRNMRTKFFMPSNFTPMNHGSYGPISRYVSDYMHKIEDRVELHTDKWMRNEAFEEIRKVRHAIGKLVNADPEDIVMVPNVGFGVTSILKSLVFNPGERILEFSTTYISTHAVVQNLVDRSNSTIIIEKVNVTYPCTNTEVLEQLEKYLETYDPTTTPNPFKLAIVDHISGYPPVTYPIDKMIPLLKAKNIPVFVDGAHAIGNVPINITALAPDYYVSSCNKWLMTPRSCAMLYVKKEHQPTTHPAVISTFYKVPSDFQMEFYWIGTYDHTKCVSVLAALEFRKEIGGEEAIMEYNNKLAWEGSHAMLEEFGTSVLQQQDQMSAMGAVELPLLYPSKNNLTEKWWRDVQFYEYPTMFAPAFEYNDKWYVRASAQIYNDLEDFKNLARHFAKIIADRKL